MFEILTLAASLFTAAPAVAQEAAPVTPAVTAPIATPPAAVVPVIAPAAIAPPVIAPAAPLPAVAQPSIWQSLGNQVIAHDTITAMDADGSKTVSHAEYTAYQETQFKALDTNGDGLLSTDEVGTSKKKSLPSLPSLPSFW